MGKILTVDCDICKKILSSEDQSFMSTVQVIYKEIGHIKKIGNPNKKFISNTEIFDIQLCDKHSLKFMNYIKDYFKTNVIKKDEK